MPSHAWTRLAVLPAALLLATVGSTAAARPTGEPQACANCHYENSEGPRIDVTFDNGAPALGETVVVTIALEAVWAQALRTGVYLTSERGGFGLLEPAATRYAMDGVLTAVLHAQPRDLDAQGRAQFQFEWTAPAEIGVTDFTVWSITGNTNGDSADDHHATKGASIAHGCTGIDYYADDDGDGFGDIASAELSCEPIVGLVAQAGDCDDADAMINPDAEERCNAVDDDCDGNADEGLEPGIYYLDTDGDGYASDLAMPEYACNNVAGYTPERGDCKPDDPAVYPGAPESDNGVDDDCDDTIDEVDPVDTDTAGTDDSGGGEPVDTDAGQDDDDGGCSVGGNRTHGAAPWAWLLILVAAARPRQAPSSTASPVRRATA